MLKWYLFETRNGDFFESELAADTKEKAIRESILLWDKYLTRHDKKHTTEFYIGFCPIDDDGYIDCDNMIEDMDLLQVLSSPEIRTKDEIEKLFDVMISQISVMFEYGDCEKLLEKELLTCDESIFNSYLDFYEIKEEM